MELAETLFPDFPPTSGSRIYFGLGENGLMKIGLTKRPSGRRGGEMHFTELCAVLGGRSMEAEYHRKYAEERLGRSEWFRLSDRLLFDVAVICKEQHRVRSYETLKSIMLGRLRPRAA